MAAVILYHLDVRGLGGGYVGVDVFFVISGYLITSMIDHARGQGTFSLAYFYERRIRRIVPALLVLLLGCAGLFWFLLMPADYQRLGQSGFAALVAASNFYFWRGDSYFHTPAAATPLLHLWSLSIEEQFYLLFPTLVLLISRLAASARVAILCAIALASLAASVVGVQTDPHTAFFFPHTRAWELLVGAILAVAPRGGTASRARSAGGWMGLALIATAVTRYSTDTPFPGWAALVPVAGAALVIWSGESQASASARLLSHRAVVYVGKISYSLYLWHFPILAAFAYVHIRPLGAASRIGIVVLSLAAASASYHLVELPFRGHRDAASRRSCFVVAGSLAAGLAALFLAIHLGRGLPNRFGPEKRALVSALSDRPTPHDRCTEKSPSDIRAGDLCQIGRAGPSSPRVLVWGDSHAEALVPAIEEIARREGIAVSFAGRRGCPPGKAPETPSPSWDRGCIEFDEAVLQFAATGPGLSDVVLISRWGELEGGTRGSPLIRDSAWDRLDDTVTAIAGKGRRVWLVGPLPRPAFDVPHALYAQSLGFDQDIDLRPSVADFVRQRARTFAILEDMAGRHGARLLLPHAVLCDAVRCAVSRDGRPYYFDDNHVTTFGARALAPILEEALVRGSRWWRP